MHCILQLALLKYMHATGLPKQLGTFHNLVVLHYVSEIQPVPSVQLGPRKGYHGSLLLT